MSLFGNMGGGSGNSLFGGGGGGGGLFGQRNTSGGGLFGSNNNMGGGGGGNSLFGGGGGGMNNNSSGNLFGNAMGNNNTGGGGLFGNRGGGGGSGLFGSNNNAGGLGSFGGGGGMMGNNNTSGGIGGGLFGNKTGGGGGGLFGGNTGGGMMGGGMMGGGLGQSTIGTFTLNYDVTNLSKSKDQLPIASITALQGYKEKSLDELRIEDYVCHKQKKIPDQILSALQAQWTKNKQGNGLGAIMGVSSGGGMFGGNTGGGILGGGGGANMFGGGGGGGLFGGGSSNTGGGLFGSSGGGGGGLFGNKTGGGGGMFGGNSNTGGGGLFGGNSNTGGGGLFGGNSNTGGGGLFGGGNNAGGGMFGGNSNTGGGGLFGGNSNTGGGGGLFGNKSGGGGLFGGNSNTGGGGGLFGGNSNTGGGGGLFGGNSNTGGGGGLFGNKSGGGGLFGGSSSTGGGGGLFSGSSNTGGGGLFGGNKTGGLFSGSNTSGGGGLFSGGGNTGGGLFSGNQGGGGGGLFSGGGGSGLFSGQKTGGLFSGSTQSGGLFSGGSNNNMNADARAMAEAQQLLAMSGVDSQQVHLYELMTSVFGPAQSNYNLFGKTLGSKDKQKEMFEKYETGTESLLTSVMKKNVKSSYNPFDKPSRREYSGIDSDLNTKIFLMNKTMGSKKKEEPTTLLGRKPEIDYLDRDTIIEDGYTDYGKKIKLSSYIEDKSTEKKTIDPKKVYDTIRLFVLFNQDDDERKFSVEIKSSCTCLELKKEILKIIFDSPYLNLAKYKLLYKNKILSDHSTVKEVGFKDNDKLFLISDTEATDDSADKFSASAFPKDQLVPEHLLPKLTKNYSTEPPLRRISRMTEEELRNVENFSIWNDDVKVTFLGKTDILGLDIDEIVMLNHRSIEVYPDNGKIPLPEAGRGLNKPATIEFYNWSVPKKYQNDLDAYRKKLESWADSQNAELVLYDPKRSIVSIKVQNFNLKD